MSYFVIMSAPRNNVAERWKKVYCNSDNIWDRCNSGDSQIVYNQLCALGDNPKTSQIVEILGNKSWTHFCCSMCGNLVEKIVQFKRNHTVTICEDCIRGAAETFAVDTSAAT